MARSGSCRNTHGVRDRNAAMHRMVVEATHAKHGSTVEKSIICHVTHLVERWQIQSAIAVTPGSVNNRVDASTCADYVCQNCGKLAGERCCRAHWCLVGNWRVTTSNGVQGVQRRTMKQRSGLATGCRQYKSSRRKLIWHSSMFSL